MKRLALALPLLLMLAAPADGAARRPDPPPDPVFETWEVDPGRSELAFRVRRLVSTVRGRFARWSGTVSVDTSDWMTAQVEIQIETASIDTGDPDRDARLRAPDFFAADSFPVTTFRSTGLERAVGGRLLLHGSLTLHGITRPVTLEVTRLDVQTDARGRHAAAMIAARGTIDRTRFNVTWNRVFEGTNVLGDDVDLDIAMHLVRRETLGRR